MMKWMLIHQAQEHNNQHPIDHKGGLFNLSPSRLQKKPAKTGHHCVTQNPPNFLVWNMGDSYQSVVMLRTSVTHVHYMINLN